jgi:hypothetical protein
MHIGRGHIKTVALWLAGTVFTVLLVAPVGQFFISLAEEWGWYQHPNAKVATVVAWFTAFAGHSWFHWIGGSIIGFAIGVWLDTLFKRQSATLAINEIDKESLASEAEILAANVSELIGDYSARAQIAWLQDPTAEGGMRFKHAEIEAKAIERYGEKYHKDVWRVIALAQKCIELDHGEIWMMSHGINYHLIEQLPILLTKIAVNLRHSQPNLPMLE